MAGAIALTDLDNSLDSECLFHPALSVIPTANLVLILCCVDCLFNDTATTEIYTLSLHDALPICDRLNDYLPLALQEPLTLSLEAGTKFSRSEEHTSELQSHSDLVCRLLLEK